MNADTPRTAQEVIGELREHPEILPFARLVGRWVWVEFPNRPPVEVRDVLRELGFRWNRKRQCWQHNCGVHCTKSVDDPRGRYGEIPVASLVEKETLATV